MSSKLERNYRAEVRLREMRRKDRREAERLGRILGRKALQSALNRGL